MKKEYDSPEFQFCRVWFLEDVLKVSTDQSSTSQIGGDVPGPGDPFGETDDGNW